MIIKGDKIESKEEKQKSSEEEELIDMSNVRLDDLGFLDAVIE